MAAGDIYEIILKGVCAGQAIYNVMHMRDEAGDAPLGDLRAHFESGDPNFLDELMSVLCNDYTIASFLATKIFPLPKGPQTEVAFATTHTGTGGSSGTLTASQVIKWVTAIGGRSGRGRNYFGPPSGDQVVDGVISALITGRSENLKNAVLSIFTPSGLTYDGDWTFVIWSKVLEAANDVVNGIVRTQAKTQRRRQLGVGI